MVKVYAKSGCPCCDKIKKYLASKGIRFTTHYVDQEDSARDACKKLTGTDYSAPVTTIDDKKFVTNYDKAALDELLIVLGGNVKW